MAISRGLVVQNGRCSHRSPSVVLRLGMRPQCTQPQAAYATANFPLVAHAMVHVVDGFSCTAIVSCGTRPAWAIGDRGGSVSPTCSGSVLNRQTSVSSASSVYTPIALWLSLRYTSPPETLHLNSDPRSPSDSLISYSVERRTTKLTQLMPCDRPSVRDRRGDCQRLLNPARRDARNAVLREPDSALLPGPSPIGAARGVDGGTRGACRRPLPGPAVCYKLFAPVHGRAGSGLCDKPAALAASYL